MRHLPLHECTGDGDTCPKCYAAIQDEEYERLYGDEE